MTTNDWTRTSTSLPQNSRLSGIGSTPTQNITFSTGVRENVSGTSSYTNAVAMSIREILIPAERDPLYIRSDEIARRTNMTEIAASTNLAPSRDRFPFKPVFKIANTNYFDRAKVEAWIDAGAPTRDGWNRIPPKEAR